MSLPVWIQRDFFRRFFIVLSLAILVACAWAALDTIQAYKLSERETEKLQSRIYNISTLVGHLADMETGQRGYVMSGERSFLEPYESASSHIQDTLGQLRDQHRGDPAATREIELLSGLVERKADFLRKTIDLRASGRGQAAVDLISSGEGHRTMDAIRDTCARLEEADRASIAARAMDMDRLADRTFWSVLAGFAASFAILLAVFVLFDREVVARRAAMDELSVSRDELKRSNEELEHFAYVASHDLQEPLRKIASFAQLLERKYKHLLDETGVRYVGYLVDGAHRMSDLINDLLMYSRAGRKSQPFAPVDLGEAVARVAESISMSVQEAGATLDIGPLPVVQGDASQLSQVFQNLMANALKFRSDRPPLVEVRAREDKDHWEFTVADNGIGISPEHREVIFRMFQRLHTREEYPGTGIGLALCKRIVNRHGGDIRVDSRPEGGSAFTFTISKSPKERA